MKLSAFALLSTFISAYPFPHGFFLRLFAPLSAPPRRSLPASLRLPLFFSGLTPPRSLFSPPPSPLPHQAAAEPPADQLARMLDARWHVAVSDASVAAGRPPFRTDFVVHPNRDPEADGARGGAFALPVARAHELLWPLLTDRRQQHLSRVARDRDYGVLPILDGSCRVDL